MTDGARSSRRRATMALIAALLAGCASAPASEAQIAAVDRLLGMLAQWLRLAPELARERWNAGASVDEPVREREIVEAAVVRSVRHILPPEVVHEVFEAQIEAAKMVQIALHAKWRAEKRAPSTSPGDGGHAVWQALRTLSANLLEALSDAYPILRGDGGRDLLERRAQIAFAGTPGGAVAATAALAPLWQLAR